MQCGCLVKLRWQKAEKPLLYQAVQLCITESPENAEKGDAAGGIATGAVVMTACAGCAPDTRRAPSKRRCQ
jgi:hypothetical protein